MKPPSAATASQQSASRQATQLVPPRAHRLRKGIGALYRRPSHRGAQLQQLLHVYHYEYNTDTGINSVRKREVPDKIRDL